MLFNKRFTAAWAADGYRDYLSPETRALETGKTVLSRLLGRGPGGAGVDGEPSQLLTASLHGYGGGSGGAMGGAGGVGAAAASPAGGDSGGGAPPPVYERAGAAGVADYGY